MGVLPVLGARRKWRALFCHRAGLAAGLRPRAQFVSEATAPSDDLFQKSDDASCRIQQVDFACVCKATARMGGDDAAVAHEYLRGPGRSPEARPEARTVIRAATHPVKKLLERTKGNPSVRTAFRAATLAAIVCGLICQQMSKREQGFGSIWSGATAALDDGREASDGGGEPGAGGQRHRGGAAA